MSLGVRVVSAPHRTEVFVEVEQDGELVAEIFREGDELRIAAIGQDGERVWEALVADVRSALQRADAELLPTKP
jgi:Mg/Co/Ni transporter MgtE